MITVYTKDYCPYCSLAKNLLDSLDVEYEEVDITDTPDRLIELYEKSRMRTVPQIYVGDTCLGGYTDILALHNEGKLTDVLKV